VPGYLRGVAGSAALAHVVGCSSRTYHGDVRSPRVRRTVLAALVLGITASACLPVTAAENGRLPDRALTTVTPQCRVVNAVAPNLEAMLGDAHAHGVDLEPERSAYVIPGLSGPPVIESCYRDYDMQVWWRNYYCFFGECSMAAVPGTSVHGWGRAVDFDDAAGELRFSSAGYQWLSSNAQRYGFVHPGWAEPGGTSPEPWHWEAT